MNLDILIPSMLLLTGTFGYNVLARYSNREDVQLRSELNTIQMKVSLYSSKVSIVEQYIEEFWKSIPDDEQDDIEELLLTRAYLERALNEAWYCLKNGHRYRVHLLINKLKGQNVSIDEELDERPLIAWEERTHKLILRMCQKLTVEASATKQVSVEYKYKRTPTLLSLKEISELLREEKGMRHEIARLKGAATPLESQRQLY